VERPPGSVEEFHFLLEEPRRKAGSAVLHNKPDRWDYYVEMVERSDGVVQWSGREQWKLRGRGARAVSESGG
jgi:hypothetical protein